MSLHRIELYFLDLIKGKRKGFLSYLLKAILYLLSWVYSFFVTCRNWVFDRGWVRRYYPPVPVVISIGNIVAGGTGKTPVTLMLAKEFYGESIISILSRGYRSKAEKMSTPVVLSRGQGPMHPASYCGDEPFMLAQNLPKAFIFVGKDRHKTSNMAAKAGVQLILLDDGMQHRRLARDFEVVVMDVYDPFGHGYFLPRGFLRESLKSLARADLIILNHVHDHERFIMTCQKIAKYTTAPVVATRTKVEKIVDFQHREVASIAGKKLGLFCGIAHPDYFETTARGLGAEIVALHTIPDHMDFDLDDLSAFSRRCAEQGAEFLVCTEKDRVKLVDTLELALPILWIKMQLEFVEGKTAWDEFIRRAKSDLARRL